MESQPTRLLYLFERHLHQECNEVERMELMRLLVDPAHQELVQSIIAERMNDVPEVNMDTSISSLILADILRDRKKVISINRQRWQWAVAVIALLAIGGYWLISSPSKQSGQMVSASISEEQDVAAPSNARAVLTLADGKQVFLDDVMNGDVAMEGNTQIIKTASGELVYEGNEDNGPLVYNTLNIPYGSKPVNITLSDKSSVWLNAGSSINYPVVFGKKERAVEITGEVYFEISKNAQKPFIVTRKNTDTKIEVLGTSFNVNAYDDEPTINCTLLEGAIRVNKGSYKQVLQPGQQAVISSTISVKNNIDVNEVMAWKNGIYQFESAEIAAIMRQLARSYNITYEITGSIRETFGGSISRDVNLSQVLKMLELTGIVDFSFEGSKIIIKPRQ